MRGPIANRQDTRRRAAQAWRLRVAGRTYTEIADELGFSSRRGAQLAIRSHLARTDPDTPEDQRRSAQEGLRLVSSLLFERIAATDDTAELALLSKEIRNNLAESIKIGGAYLPTRSEVDIKVEHSAVAIIERAERELLALAAGRTQRPRVIDAEPVEEIEA